MAPKRPQSRVLLVKVVCQSVIARLEGDRVVAEQEGPRIACYSPDDLAALWEKAEAEVAAENTNLRRSK